MISILLKRKAEILKEFSTGLKEIKIGRSPRKNNIVIKDKQVSETHCVIRRTEEGFEVEDLNTSFGTLVNGKKITKQNISFNDEIQVGSYILNPVQSSPADRQPCLLAIHGKMTGRKFELNPGETRIGRSGEFNDLWIPKDIDPSVSRRHATVIADGGKYILSDKRSKNRTFLNQRQLKETDELHLKEGDEILIGKNIFRFLPAGKEDYSYPGKAGILWTRLFPKLRIAVFLMLFGAGAYSAYTGLSSLMIIDYRPAQHSLTVSPWRPEGLSLTPGGFLQEEQLDITPSPAVGDVTGDGANEIVIASPGGDIYVWNSEGKLLWRKNFARAGLTTPQLIDISGNRRKDIVFGSDDSRIYAVDGRTGQLIYRSTFLGGRVLPGSAILVDDIDGSGFNDIVAVTDDRVICFIYSPVVGVRRPYYFSTADDIMSSPVLIQSGDSKHVAVPTNGGNVYVFEGSNPDNRRVFDVTGEINRAAGLNLVLNEINTSPASVDLNNDGTDDLVCAAGSYYVTALSGADGSLIWKYRIEPFSLLEPPLRYGSPVIADLNGNGRPDVAIAWANGRIIALEGATGRELWDFTTRGENNRIIASAALADFNKDGLANPVVASEDGSVFIIDGRGSGDNMVLASADMNVPITATPVIADITGDGYLDIAILSVDGNLRLLTTSLRVFRNETRWPLFRNTPDNRAVMFYEDRQDIYSLYAASGVFAILAVMVSVIIIKKRRKRNRPRTVKI